MWTIENRHRYDRDKLRYPCDLTDAEWQSVKLLNPPAKRGNSKRTANMRKVVNGMMNRTFTAWTQTAVAALVGRSCDEAAQAAFRSTWSGAIVLTRPSLVA